MSVNTLGRRGELKCVRVLLDDSMDEVDLFQSDLGSVLVLRFAIGIGDPKL